MARDDTPYMGGFGYSEPAQSGPTHDEVVAAAKNAAARAATYRSSDAGFATGAFSEKPSAEKKDSNILTVSEVANIANSILKNHTFHVMGEVSELSDKPGYKAVYFTVKDEGAVMTCLMWKNRYQASGMKLFIGAKVELTGKFSIFARSGKLDFNVYGVKLAGEGALRQQVAQLAEKLKAEGLMEASRKRPIPRIPLTVGIVTSPNGAVVHDALRTFRRRFPMARMVVAGVPVEGATAAHDMTEALQLVCDAGVEVILLLRGGGSFESFMPFNDEGLARAIAACPVPVVTGIGHEPDTTIADMVSDYRASTPTQAALAVSPDSTELLALIDTLFGRMDKTLVNRLNRSVEYLDSLASRPVLRDPASMYEADARTLDMFQDRMERAASQQVSGCADAVSQLASRINRVGPRIATSQQERLDSYEARLRSALPRALQPAQGELSRLSSELKAAGDALLAGPNHQVSLAGESLARLGKTLLDPFYSEAAVATARLNDLSPLHILERGWSIARAEDGSVLRSVNDAKPNDVVEVQLIDGALSCRVEKEAVSELSELLSLGDSDE